MEYDLPRGRCHSDKLAVKHQDTAAVYGSGSLEVFANNE